MHENADMNTLPVSPPIHLMSASEAGKLIHASARYLQKMMAAGELAFVRIGRQKLTTHEALAEFVKRRTVSIGCPTPSRMRGPKPGSRRVAK